MLDFVRGRASIRKLRLFTVACCRLFQSDLGDSPNWAVLETAERVADGMASDTERAAAFQAACDYASQFAYGIEYQPDALECTVGDRDQVLQVPRMIALEY